LFPFFNAHSLTVPIVGNIKAVTSTMVEEYYVIFFDSTRSLPSQGIADKRFVIHNFEDICSTHQYSRPHGVLGDFKSTINLSRL